MPAARKAVPTEQTIRERAYYLWEQDGRPHGKDVEYWSRASAEAAPQPKRARTTRTSVARKKA